MSPENRTPLLYLVDDDEDDTQLLRIALRHFLPAAIITAFTDGKEVISSLQKSLAKLPDLIVLDLNMPVVCGHDVLKWIRQKAKLQVPVVIFSTSRAEADHAACELLGANDYICKPNEIAGYELVAQKIFNKWFSAKSA